MKKIFYYVLIAFAFITVSTNAQKTITIKGKVEFPDNQFKMEINTFEGFDKIVVDSCDLNDDGTYEFKFEVKKTGSYTLNCQKWQTVSFWAEDEDLSIDFRGKDTARVVIKNPPYVHIKGGPNNDLMNLHNWNLYRNYQMMITLSQTAYKIEGLDNQAKQDVSMKFYDMLDDDFKDRTRFLLKNYSDRNSVIAILPYLRGDKELPLINEVLNKIEKRNPNYKPAIDYKNKIAEEKAIKEKIAIGNTAPEFSFATPDGKSTLGPQDFKGKILVLDFWASWCGPCRQEIPNMKKDYERFSDKGVEFFGVSIDSKEADWQKALESENMPWPQALAPNGGKDVMKQYQFSGIPFILILDEDGKILGKNIRGQKLTEKLEELTSK